jgi:heavy metal translocating P-type ATPase
MNEDRTAYLPETCALCGLPRGRSRLRLQAGGKVLPFCCPGCLHVFQILSGRSGEDFHDFRASELFRTCVAAGLIPATAKTEAVDSRERFDPKAAAGLPPEDPGIETVLTIQGLWCVSCSWLIEEILRQTDGVLSAEVVFMADIVKVRYQPHRINRQAIAKKIEQLGYRACPRDEGPDAVQRKSFLRLGVASILTFNIMMISFAVYGGFFEELGKTGIRTLSLPLCLLATPVVFYSGWPILLRGWLSLQSCRFSMDTLIAVGALTAYGYSFYEMMHGSLHLYFDTAAMLVTLVLLGRFIEHRVRRQVTAGVNLLHDLVGGKIRMELEGREKWMAIAAMRAGDSYVVKAGERVPVDGRVLSGRAEVDESVLTGEARPVEKRTDDEVLAGSLLLAGDLRLAATRVGAKSSIGQMMALVQGALAAKNSIEQLADRITVVFVPLVLVMAAATAIVLLFAGAAADTAILRAVTILVIACPCALGIATPLAKVAILGRGKEQGILIRDATAFEQAYKLDAMVFDKTGTVTEGNFTLRSLYAPAHSEAEVLHRLAAVECLEEHFLAREVRRYAMERGLAIETASSCRSFPGLGVAGRVHGEEVAVGSRRFMEHLQRDIPEEIAGRAAADEKKGLTVIFVAWQNRVRAMAAFGDVLKSRAPRVIAQLRAKGIQVWLVSGDSQATTAAVAAQLGIGRFVGRTSPEDKVSLVRGLQAQGRRVGMIGDGVNDSAALAQADIGFAVGCNLGHIMEEAADVTLLGGGLDRLPATLALSRQLVRAVRQNLALAFLYNGLGIPLAMLGMLNPLLAVFAMLVSSLTVIGNTLRIAKTGTGVGRETTGGRIVEGMVREPAIALPSPGTND